MKFVVGKFDDFTFYAGESGDEAGAIAFSYQKEEDDDLDLGADFDEISS